MADTAGISQTPISVCDTRGHGMDVVLMYAHGMKAVVIPALTFPTLYILMQDAHAVGLDAVHGM